MFQTCSFEQSGLFNCVFPTFKERISEVKRKGLEGEI